MATIEYLYCPFCASHLQIKIEENKKRKYCAGCEWTYYPTPPIASAAVITKNDPDIGLCALMVKRKREPFAGTWMFPAGFLEQDEHPEKDTLPREVKEEVGLIVTDSRLMEIVKSISDPRSSEHLVLFYDVQATGNIKNNDTDENSDIGWMPVGSNVDIGFPHHRIIFNQLRRV